METINFNKLLLKTAFSCMACDGNIDKREVRLIKNLHKEHKTFGEIDINSELDTLLLAINKDGHQFLKDYLEQDIISESYLSRLQDDFFDMQVLSEFEIIREIDYDILRNLKDKNEKK